MGWRAGFTALAFCLERTDLDGIPQRRLHAARGHEEPKNRVSQAEAEFGYKHDLPNFGVHVMASTIAGLLRT